MKILLTTIIVFNLLSLRAQVGRVGINENNPTTELDIKTFDVNDGSEIHLGNSDNSHYLRLFSGRSGFPSPIIFWKPGDPLVFGTNTIGQIDFTEWMRIQSNGEVGIGIQDPLNELHIKGPTWVGLTIEAEANDPFIQLTSTTNGPLTNNGEWTVRNDVSNDKSFEINYNNMDLVSIDTIGRVGIGTDDPVANLDVNGFAKISSLSATTPRLVLSTVDGFLVNYNPVTSLNAASFHCSEHSSSTPYTSRGRFAWGGENTSSSSCPEMISNVSFLHQDLISSITVRFYDQSATSNLRFRLFRLDINGFSNLIAELLPIENSPSFTLLTQSDLFSPISIDNINSSYYISVSAVNSTGSIVPWTNNLSIASIHIQ